MAIFSMNISNVSRAKGSSSCATLSYITAEKVRDDRLGQSFNFGRRERVLEVGTILPDGAPEDYRNPAVLFNAIEAYDAAVNARPAKKIMAALPIEFDQETRVEVVETFIHENLTALGYACTYAIHLDKDGRNPHVHFLIINRPLDRNGKWSVKSRKEYALDENGDRIPQIDPATGEQKLGKRNEKLWKRTSVLANPLDQKETLVKLREQWAVICNEHLSEENQIDHRSYVERQIDIIPTVHEGYAAREMEMRGEDSDRCSINRDIADANKELNKIYIESMMIDDPLQVVVKVESDRSGCEIARDVMLSAMDMENEPLETLVKALKYDSAENMRDDLWAQMDASGHVSVIEKLEEPVSQDNALRKVIKTFIGWTIDKAEAIKQLFVAMLKPKTEQLADAIKEWKFAIEVRDQYKKDSTADLGTLQFNLKAIGEIRDKALPLIDNWNEQTKHLDELESGLQHLPILRRKETRKELEHQLNQVKHRQDLISRDLGVLNISTPEHNVIFKKADIDRLVQDWEQRSQKLAQELEMAQEVISNRTDDHAVEVSAAALRSYNLMAAMDDIDVRNVLDKWCDDFGYDERIKAEMLHSMTDNDLFQTIQTVYQTEGTWHITSFRSYDDEVFYEVESDQPWRNPDSIIVDDRGLQVLPAGEGFDELKNYLTSGIREQKINELVNGVMEIGRFTAHEMRCAGDILNSQVYEEHKSRGRGR